MTIAEIDAAVSAIVSKYGPDCTEHIEVCLDTDDYISLHSGKLYTNAGLQSGINIITLHLKDATVNVIHADETYIGLNREFMNITFRAQLNEIINE